MKKLQITIFTIAIITAMPSFAVCPIDNITGGACSPTGINMNTVMPYNLENLQRPYDTNNQSKLNPYNNIDNNITDITGKDFQRENTPQNCLFGVCLP